MFGWFRPHCPVPPPEQLWIDRRMTWLAQTFGADRLRQAEVVLPTPEFFPGPYRGTEEHLRRVFRRVCRYMGVEPNRLDVGLFTPPHPDAPEAMGLYVPGPREKVLLADTQLGDPVAAVATLAHELAHALLLGDNRIRRDEGDHEQVTDLLTVFLGFGVFGSNSVMREDSKTYGNWHYWRISRQGYLSERMYGYACALFAQARCEGAPAWAGHLRPNVRAVFKQSLTYLSKTGDSRFRPDAPGAGDEGPPLARWLEELQSPWPASRLGALEALKGLGEEAAAVPAVTAALHDPDPFVQAEAAAALGAFRSAAGPAVPDLLDAALREDNPDLRRAAVTAVGQVARQADPALRTLLRVAKAPDPYLRCAAAWSLGRFSPPAGAALARLAELLEDVDQSVAIEAALALASLGPGAAPAVPALVRTIDSGEGDVPAACAAALGEIGAVVPEVVPALRRALEHPDTEVGAEAASALRRVAPEFAPPEPAKPRKRKRKRRRWPGAGANDGRDGRFTTAGHFAPPAPGGPGEDADEGRFTSA
jgi:HEAT repeat protein